ncbi:MAG: hypothetical protein QOF21_2742 [Actinomycetota bacterium]|jgi:class 3 adenylate cyclase/tetratricopeptide (TPR) repeat protein
MPTGRTLTVLVAEIVESTRLNTGLGPARADEVRRMIFSRFDEAAATHRGTVVKTMGDGCLVTFDGASEGVAAGIEMVAALDRLARQVEGLKVRIGVAAGDVTEDDGDVFGDAVVVASRLCGAAAPGQVLATDLVRELAGTRGAFEWERVGDLFLKGIEEPVATSAARASREETTRLRMPHALRARPGELFVGRTDQLELLNYAWKDSTDDQRRTVLVTGEPGVGKTRLVAAQARKIDEADGLVLFARCAEDLAVPYQPFADALRVSVENAPRELLAAHYAEHGGELRRLFPKLNAPEPIEASPEVERLRLFGAVSDFLMRLTTELPVTLVFDDIHWAAPATLQLLKHLITDTEPAQLFILATYRDTEVDRRHPLGALLGDVSDVEGVVRVTLGGLNPDEMEWLIEAASGDDLDDAGISLARALHERTSGNPFFASQVLRHMAEAGALVHGLDGWEQRTAGLDLPEGVLDVVGRRLSRLGETTTDVLSLGAVAGLSFTRAVLARAAGIDDVDGPLEDAVRARLLTDNGQGGYTFAHAIVRDALLRELSTMARARRHHSIAMAMLDVHGDTDLNHVHDLAYHFTEAALVGDTKNLARFSVAAAEECIRRSDADAAIEVLQRAWKAIETHEPVDHEARFDVCARLNRIHYGHIDGVVDALEAAGESARALHSPERLIDLSFSSFRWDTGIDDPYALALVDDALNWLDPAPSVRRACALASRAYLSNVHSHGDPKPWFDAALTMLDELGRPNSLDGRIAMQHIVMGMIGQPGAARILEIVESFDDSRDASSSGSNRAIYLSGKACMYAGIGDRETCDEIVALLRDEADETHDPSLVVYSRGWDVMRAFRDGDFANVQQYINVAFSDVGIHVANLATLMAAWQMWLAYEEGRSAEIIGALRMVAASTPGVHGMNAAVATHLAEAGLLEEAREMVDVIVDALPSMGRNATYGTTLALTAHAAAHVGDRLQASALLEELDPFSGEIIFLSSVVGQGAADRYRGALLSILDRHDEAIRALETAIALERRLGAEPFVVRSQYWLGRAFLAAGLPDDARDAFRLSRHGAESLGMFGVVRHVDEQFAMIDV